MSLIFKKMIDVMRDVGPVGKDGYNKTQQFKFRGIDQFVNALYPALIKNGVFMTAEKIDSSFSVREVIRSSGKSGMDTHVSLTMKYTFWAEDGSSVSSIIPGEGLDIADKATNKALSGSLKYCLIQTLSIPTEDMEDQCGEDPKQFEGEAPKLPSNVQSIASGGGASGPSQAQLKRLFAIASKCGVSTDQIHQGIKYRYNIESLQSLTPQQYQEVCDGMEIKTSASKVVVK